MVQLGLSFISTLKKGTDIMDHQRSNSMVRKLYEISTDISGNIISCRNLCWQGKADGGSTYRAAFGAIITWWAFGARWTSSTRGTCFPLFTSFTFRAL